jgi:hypothetical protein
MAGVLWSSAFVLSEYLVGNLKNSATICFKTVIILRPLLFFRFLDCELLRFLSSTKYYVRIYAINIYILVVIDTKYT